MTKPKLLNHSQVRALQKEMSKLSGPTDRTAWVVYNTHITNKARTPFEILSFLLLFLKITETYNSVQ